MHSKSESKVVASNWLLRDLQREISTVKLDLGVFSTWDKQTKYNLGDREMKNGEK